MSGLSYGQICLMRLTPSDGNWIARSELWTDQKIVRLTVAYVQQLVSDPNTIARAAGLAPFLQPRPLPIVPLQHRRRLGFEGEALQEADIAWAVRHPDVRTDAAVSALDEESAWADLQQMGVRSSSS